MKTKTISTTRVEVAGRLDPETAARVVELPPAESTMTRRSRRIWDSTHLRFGERDRP
jgi:hypothetical protein